MDQALAKAEPISDSGSTSGITFKTGRKIAGQQQQPKKQCKHVRETTLQTPMSVKKEGEKVLQALEQRISFSPWSRPQWSRYPAAACGGPVERGAHAGAGLLAGLVTL